MFFIVCWVLTIIAAIAITVLNWLRYTTDRGYLFGTLLETTLWWAIVALSTPVEVLHAITR